MNGVDLFSWDQFIANGFHMMYEEMGMRHLHGGEIRGEEWLKRLEEFIKENRGKRYRLNPLELFK